MYPLLYTLYNIFIQYEAVDFEKDCIYFQSGFIRCKEFFVLHIYKASFPTLF